MKKTIKYSGIAVAALLVVSPIATQVFNQVTTVQADVSVPDGKTEEDLAQKMGESLSGQVLKYDFDKVPALKDDLDAGYATAVSKNITDGSILISPFLKGMGTQILLGYASPLGHEDKRTLLSTGEGSVYYTLKIYDPDGNQITNATDLNKIIQDGGNNGNFLKGYTEDIGLAYENDASGTNFTELDGAKGMNIIDVNDISSVDLSWGPSEITVKQGSSVDDIDSKYLDATVIDNKGNQIGKSYGTTTYGYYSSFEDANNAINVVGRKYWPDQVDMGDTFKTPGTYYRDIGVFISGVSNYYMQDYINENSGAGNVTVAGEVAPKEQAVSPDQDYYLGGGNGYDYIQKVTVTPTSSGSSSGSKNTSHDIKGIVTTHTDKKSYSLYDTANAKVDDRALLADSSWKVDGVRTISGVKQYRVSTSEWVNASDVVFIENGKVVEGMTVKKLDTPKEISLATNHNMYNLYNSKQEVSSVRALAGGTDWLVDKIGTDMHGDVYYGVSTDEFVKAGDGVSVVK